MENVASKNEFKNRGFQQASVYCEKIFFKKVLFLNKNTYFSAVVL